MAKRSGQKLRLLYLYRIMLEQTDRITGITLSAISRELEKYGIVAERKTLYDDIEALRLYGVDIQTRRSRGVEYYLGSRPISPLIAKLISETVSSSPYLSEKDRSEVISKLLLVGGKNLRGLLDDNSEPVDSHDRELFGNLNLLCQAIASGHCVLCRCFEWNSRKQRIMLYDGEKLKLSPWRLHFGEHPILTAYDHNSKKIVRLRADRLLGVEMITLAREGREALIEFEGHGGSHDPHALMVRFRCANSFADEVISHFGVDITVSNNSEEYFEFSVKTTLSKDLYAWVFVNSRCVELISPDSAVEEYRQMLKDARSL